MTSHIRRLAGDTAIYGLLDVFNRLVSVFLVPLYARILSPAEYGAVELASTLITVLYAVVTVGMDSAATQFFHRSSEETRRSVMSTAVLFVTSASCIAALVILVFRARLAPLLLRDARDAETLLVLAALSLPVMVVASFMSLFLRIRFQRRRFAVLAVTTLVINIAANFAFVAFLGLGPKGVLLAQMISSASGCVLGAWLTRDLLFATPSLSTGMTMLRYGMPLIVPGVAYWFSLYAERFAVGTMAGMTAVGLFGIAAKIAAAVTILSSAVDYAWMPFAMSIQTREDAPRTYAEVLTLYVAVCGLAGTILTIFAREILVLVAAPSFHPAFVIVGPIVASLVARGAINILAIGSFVTGRTTSLAAVSAVATVIHLIALYGGVMLLGALGAALATLAARCFSAAGIYRASRHSLPVPYDWNVVFKCVALFVAAVLVSIPAGRLSLGAALAVKFLVILPVTTALLLAATGLHRHTLLRTLLSRFLLSPSQPED